MKKLLSIIIPAYNVEKYISDCLDSIEKSVYKINDFEIIIINDGSTDQTHKVISSYIKQSQFADKYIYINQKDNCGQSFARNVALEKSNGKYISFIDADDLVDVNIYFNTLELMEKLELDIINFPHEVFFEDYKKNYISRLKKIGPQIMNGRKYISYKPSPSPCDKIYKKEFLLENEFKFAEGRIAEDALAISILLSQAERIKYLNTPLYRYRKESEGSTRNKKTLQHQIKMSTDKLFVAYTLYYYNKEYKHVYFRRIISRNIIGSYMHKYIFNKKFRLNVRQETKGYKISSIFFKTFRIWDIFYYVKVFLRKITRS